MNLRPLPDPRKTALQALHGVRAWIGGSVPVAMLLRFLAAEGLAAQHDDWERDNARTAAAIAREGIPAPLVAMHRATAVWHESIAARIRRNMAAAVIAGADPTAERCN